MTSGNAPLTAKERIEQVLKSIGEYEQKVGLGRLLAGNEVERYMNMSASDMRKLSPNECYEAMAILLKEAAYLQQEINRNKSIAQWCVEQINTMVADRLHQYGSQYTPAEYKRKLAIKESEMATKLDTYRLYAAMRIQLLEYMPTQIQQVAKAFESMARSFQGRQLG